MSIASPSVPIHPPASPVMEIANRLVGLLELLPSILPALRMRMVIWLGVDGREELAGHWKKGCDWEM
eukprot:1748982-Rhodomonas_salina.1